MFEPSGLAKKYKIKKCESPTGKMTRFVEPCILFFLSQKPSYGYELMEEISRFGFEKSRPDPALVYRMLRYLEKEGFVSSKWDTGGTGPAKRNYTITAKGLKLLHEWADAISIRKAVLEQFLDKYNERFKKKSGGRK